MKNLSSLSTLPPKAIMCLTSYLWANNCYAGNASINVQEALIIVIPCILLLQTIIIISLQRSRIKNKGARSSLQVHQKDLEYKIHERTQNLYQKNTELEKAIEDYKIIAVQLQDTKRHLQTMINSVPDILIGISADEKVTYWNTAAFDKTGLSFDKALGTNILDALPQLPITPEQLSYIIKSEQPFINQRIQAAENNENKFYDLRIYPLVSNQKSGAVIQLKNVTSQVNIEQMLIQNEKMSSLGELAAGIAHEINNPLGIILHNVQNIIRRTSNNLPSNITAAEKFNVNFQDICHYLNDREVDQFLDNIKEAGERAAAIVHNMLEFSRITHNEKNWVDFKELVEKSIELNIKSNFDDRDKIKDIKVTTKFSHDFPLLYASAPELQQVLMNLLRNAYQALISDNYKKPEVLSVNIAASLNTRKHEVIIEISDNGPGIKDSVKDHIFEPFFTTKEVGKGTGLGLSVSYFIITEHHQGSISVSSQLNKGTTFKICLPILVEQQYSFDI
ncbi:MAG: ATP-binding protein [Pseudomonadota bacterium]